MSRLPLEQPVAPIREHRTGAIKAYLGSAKQLLEDAKNGRLKAYDRNLECGWHCASGIAAGHFRMSNITDAVLIVHSPMGCISNITQFAAPNLLPKGEGKELDGLGGYKPFEPARWYCSNLTEEEVIFGAEGKLEETILAVDRINRPRSIWILTSCVSGIMGDDIEGVVEKVQPKVNATIVPVHCEPFQSRLPQWGHDGSAHAIMKYLVKKPTEKRKNMINVVAAYAVMWKAWIYMADLLKKVGIECNFVPELTTTKSFEILGEAALTVCLCPTWGDYLAKALEQEYGIPYIRDIVPFGIARTELWLREIAQYLGKEAEMEKLIAEERAPVIPKVEEYRKKWQGKRVFLSIGSFRAYHMPHMLVGDFGMELAGINFYEFDDENIVDLENLLQLTGGKDFLVDVSDAQTMEMANYLKKLNVDVFLGHVGSLVFMLKHGIPTGNCLGEWHQLRKDKWDGGMLGYNGVLNVARYLSKVIGNPAFGKKLSEHVKLPFKDAWYQQDPHINLVKPV